jgi:hypothetical protein
MPERIHATCIVSLCTSSAILVREVGSSRTAIDVPNGQDGSTTTVHVGDPAGLFRCLRNHEFEIELRLARPIEHQG